MQRALQFLRQLLGASPSPYEDALSARLDSLRLVLAPPSTEGFTAWSEDGRRLDLYTSQFNPDWILELEIAPRHILDVGSYDAGDAIRFKKAFPLARVICFEPDPDRFDIVSFNATAFGIEAHQLALLDRAGFADLYRSSAGVEASSGQGSIYRETAEYKKRHPHIVISEIPTSVRCTRVDLFCAENGIDDIDVAHIDVEGAEYEVLQGMGPIRPKLIFAETSADEVPLWEGSKRPKELHRLLSRMGYLLGGDFGTDRLYIRSDLFVD